MTPVEMPKANENMAEATLQDWIVKEGQTVVKDDPLCTIITDKATFEMPSPAGGVIRKILGEPRSMLPVGYVMCLIGDEDEEVSEDYAERNRAMLEAHRGSVAEAPGIGAAPGARPAAPKGGKVRATPAARRVAKAAGVSLEDVKEAMGVKGVINEKDVQSYVEKQK